MFFVFVMIPKKHSVGGKFLEGDKHTYHYHQYNASFGCKCNNNTEADLTLPVQIFNS